MKLGVVGHAYNPSPRKLRQEDQEFKNMWLYITRQSLKTKVQ
jgi:hypothetical protein